VIYFDSSYVAKRYPMESSQERKRGGDTFLFIHNQDVARPGFGLSTVCYPFS
jgi:hypothetical protein